MGISSSRGNGEGDVALQRLHGVGAAIAERRHLCLSANALSLFVAEKQRAFAGRRLFEDHFEDGNIVGEANFKYPTLSVLAQQDHPM